MNWNEWVEIMDQSIGVLYGAIIGVGGSILVNWLGNRKGYKDIGAKLGKLDNTTLVGFIDQKVGNLNNQFGDHNTTLSGQHEHIEAFIKQSIGEIPNTTLSGQHNTILSAVKSLENQLKSEKDRENLNRQQLTGDQARIGQSIETLSAFAKLMVDLQAQNNVLLQENQTLKQENSQLKEQVEAPEEESQEDGITLS